MIKLSKAVSLSMLLLATPVVWGQKDVFDTGRLSPLPVDSKRGAFQNTSFDAFEIPEYKLDQAYVQKAREEINTLKRVLATTRLKNQRTDTQHRLAEAYWDVERTIYLKKMENYQKEMDLYLAKKQPNKPKVPTFSGKNTFELYNTIIKTNPEYKRLDEILFSAGFRGEDAHQKNHHKYLQALVKKYPNSAFVPDAYFKIGSHYFDEREFDQAIDNFNQILKTPNSLHNQALYKISWCYFNQLKFTLAKKVMQKVVENTRSNKEDADLRKESLRDLVLIYSELGEFEEADHYFTSIGEPEYAVIVLEQLSDIYFDQSRYDLAIKTITLLLKKVPYSPSAPKYHSKLIDCYDRSQRLATAMKEMSRYLGEYEPDSRWHRENPKPETRAYARDRSEVYARFLATRYHEESQEYEAKDPKKSENFALTAMGFYKKYFERFSDHPKAYNLRMLYAELLFEYQRFDDAAVQYESVVRSNPKGKHTKKALIGQIDSLNKIETENYKRVQPIAESKKAAGESLPLPDNANRLIIANTMYVQLFPRDEISPKTYFQRARLYYNYNIFDRALVAFGDVIQKYPTTDSANQSRDLILDIYNIQKNWTELQKTAEGYLTVATYATPKTKNTLLDLIQGAIFQQGKEKEKEKKYLEAAAIYRSLVDRYPNSKYADKALYNAALDYIQADQADQAILTANLFLSRYPNSELAPDMLLSLATYFDDKLDFQNAAVYFELFVAKKPTSELAPDALFNAALYREQLNQFTTALQNYKKHETLYPTSKDLETVRFSQALVLEKQKKTTEAIAAFNDFATHYGRKSSRTTESYYRMGQLQESINQRANATASYQAALTIFKRQGMISESANHYASKAKFALLDPTFNQYRALQLTMPQSVLERNLQKKFDLIRTLKKEYLQIVKMNDPEMSVASLNRLGLAYQDLSAGLFAAPLPTNLSPEEIQMYQGELQNQALPLEQQAIEAFETALSKSHELKVYTQAAKDAYNQLSQYKPNQYPSVRFPLIIKTYGVEPWSSDFEGGQP